jgi:hypothetical protein
MAVMSTTEDLNAISAVNEEGLLSAALHSSEDAQDELIPQRDPVIIRGAGNVTVLVFCTFTYTVRK